MAKLINLKGMKFGRLTVLRRAPGKATRNAYKNAMWVCKCDCGTIKSIAGPNIRRGDTVSCGCYRSEKVRDEKRIHGMSNSIEWRTWSGIIQRCHNPKSDNYHRYGGSGIEVCPRWRTGFINFFSDMGKRPNGKYSLERIDNSKGYSPENCKWATVYEQARNRRDIRLIEYNGEKLCLLDWAIRAKVGRNAIYALIAKGKSPENSVAEVMQRDPNRDTKIMVDIEGKNMSIKDWATELKVTVQSIYNLTRKMSAKEAILQIKKRQARSAELLATIQETRT